MATIKSQINDLLQQEMDRKSFLRYSGGIVLALLGVTGLLRILLSSNKTSSPLVPTTKDTPHGYGMSKYGQ